MPGFFNPFIQVMRYNYFNFFTSSAIGIAVTFCLYNYHVKTVPSPSTARRTNNLFEEIVDFCDRYLTLASVGETLPFQSAGREFVVTDDQDIL